MLDRIMRSVTGQKPRDNRREGFSPELTAHLRSRGIPRRPRYEAQTTPGTRTIRPKITFSSRF